MKIRCAITIEYQDAATAKTVLQATQVDDFDFVHAHLKEKKLEAELTNTSLSALIHTLDDYLACVSVAEKVAHKD